MFDEIDQLEVSQEEVAAALDKAPGEACIIDVRETWELARGILPGAVHMPLSHFDDFVSTFEQGQSYIIYCEHGVRSLDVAVWLHSNKGINAKSMRGGFAEWTQQVEPYNAEPQA